MLVEDEEEKKSVMSEEKQEANRRSKQMSRLNSRFGKESYSITELPEREFNEDLALYSHEESKMNDITIPPTSESNMFGKLDNGMSSDDERGEEEEEEESDSDTEEPKIEIIPQEKVKDVPLMSEVKNGTIIFEEEIKSQNDVKSSIVLENIEGKGVLSEGQGTKENLPTSSEQKKEEEILAEKKDSVGELSDENVGED